MTSRVLIAFGFVPLFGSSAGAGRYTLEQLLAKVRSEYPGVQAARDAVDSADAQLSTATRLWAPSGEIRFGITGAPNV